jgi:3-oxoacyl-[acyl-carrier protein] reductase
MSGDGRSGMGMVGNLAKMDLRNNTVLVFGASGGLGRHIAVSFGNVGAKVICAGTNEMTLQDTIDEIIGNGGIATMEVVDIMFEQEVEELSGYNIDVMVNCAGFYTEGLVHNVDRNDWAYTVTTNLYGAFYAMKHVIPGMKERMYGRIINIGSFAADVTLPGTAAYSASKAGMVALTKVVAKEVAPYGITANVVSPGTFNAGMVDEFDDDVKQLLLDLTPSGRMGSPSELSWAVMFLASPHAGYINGEVLHVDGGI